MEDERMMRLDKFLCETGFGTRSQVKELLKKGQVTVNGVAKIDEHKDQITCQGKIASYEKYVYYMLHKPAGVVSATEDKREKTVLDLLKSEDRRDGIFPVGRLDKDTEGFLLLTDDGDLAHRLLSPRKHVDKTYYAKIAAGQTPYLYSEDPIAEEAAKNRVDMDEDGTIGVVDAVEILTIYAKRAAGQLE